MNIENLPNPVATVNILITSLEDLGNLKMIDVIWFLCPQQREQTHNNLLVKVNFLKSKIEKNPSQKKELEKEFIVWAETYVHHDNVILFYAELSYGLLLKDFIKGFPSVIKTLKKQESFIRNVTPQQQRFLDILVESSFCKAIAEGNKPTLWDFYKVMVKFTTDNEYEDLSKIALSINFKILRLISQFYSNQNKTLKEFQEFFSKLFGDYMFEINTHYFINYFYENDDLKGILNSNDAEFKNESVVEIEDGRRMDIYLPKTGERKANDGITSLSLKQTAYLFNMLRSEKIIFKDESYQTKENIYKAIQVLTGYSKQTIKEAMNLRDFEDSDKVVTQKMLQKLIP